MSSRLSTIVNERPVPDHSYFANLIWQIADLLHGPYRPPQYERVMLPMTVQRRFDCVLASTKGEVLAEYRYRKEKLAGDALDSRLNRMADQRFHNQSELDFEKLLKVVSGVGGGAHLTAQHKSGGPIVNGRSFASSRFLQARSEDPACY